MKYPIKLIAAFSLLSFSCCELRPASQYEYQPDSNFEIVHQFEILGSNGYCLHSWTHMGPGFCEIWG